MPENNSPLGSCDQAVRQAGGLVLELWVALKEWEREEEEKSKAVCCLYSFHMQFPIERQHKTVEDDMLSDVFLLMLCPFVSLHKINTNHSNKSLFTPSLDNDKDLLTFCAKHILLHQILLL